MPLGVSAHPGSARSGLLVGPEAVVGLAEGSQHVEPVVVGLACVVDFEVFCDVASCGPLAYEVALEDGLNTSRPIDWARH
jgi:hypothetical protein